MVFGIAHVINNFLGNIGWGLKGICWELFLWKLLVFFGYHYFVSGASGFDFYVSFFGILGQFGYNWAHLGIKVNMFNWIIMSKYPNQL